MFDQLFENFAKQQVLIIGDVMIDSYLWGKVERISPEAPVPVLNLQKREQRLGGAANVALNVQALGATPILCAVIGKDVEGDQLLKLLEQNNLSTEGIIQSEHRVTTIKHRIIAASQHVLRIDAEVDTEISSAERELLLAKIKTLLTDTNVVIFEDYDKGVIGESLIAETVTLTKALGIPTVVDPKKRNFMHYHGVSLFKPNLKELKEGLKADFKGILLEDVKAAVAELKSKLSLEGALITLSEHGVYIDAQNEQVQIPAHKREIADVSGAGDTVVSVAALCVALNLHPSLIAGLSNLAGGIVCEHVGVVPIDKEVLKSEAIRLLTV
jgi:rfaE bifunctional protein kinase chain/domain